MVAEVVRQILIADTVDRTAAQARAANPDITMWDNDAKVPLHMYQSLRTLVGAPDAPTLAKRVVALYGLGTTRPEASIEIRYIPEDSFESELLPVDTVGAETARLHLLFRLPPPVDKSTSAQTVQAMELRTRWLIDTYVRSIKRQVAGSIPVAGDTSVLDDYFYCSWQRYISPPDAIELAVEYNVEYVRAFGA